MVKHPDSALANFLSSESIDWHFIPPKSLNFGGHWEAGVKSFKFYLKRVIVNVLLIIEDLLPIILENESVLNSISLTPLSSDFDNFETLSPGHFLIGRSLNSITNLKLIDLSDNRLFNCQKNNKIQPTNLEFMEKGLFNELSATS